MRRHDLRSETATEQPRREHTGPGYGAKFVFSAMRVQALWCRGIHFKEASDWPCGARAIFRGGEMAPHFCNQHARLRTSGVWGSAVRLGTICPRGERFACARGVAGVVSGCSRAALPERRCSQPLTLPQKPSGRCTEVRNPVVVCGLCPLRSTGRTSPRVSRAAVRCTETGRSRR